ncbi:MAG TPA: hypothetical protein VGL61_03190 [Kofleriaceae bacterium]
MDLADGVKLCLLSIATSRFIYFCPFCGCAWHSPRGTARDDEIRSIEEVAPEGIELPTRERVATCGHRVVPTDFDEWIRWLVDAVERSWPAR